MKKKLILLFVSVSSFCIYANAQSNDYNNISYGSQLGKNISILMIKPDSTDNADILIDSINFRVNSISQFSLKLEITNKTQSYINVDWNNSRLQTSEIVFGDMTTQDVSKPIPSYDLAPGNSISKNIISKHVSLTNYMFPMIDPKILKKYKQTFINYSIYIIKNDVPTKYDFTLKISYDK